MKIILNKFLIVVLFLFSAVLIAQDDPPCPGGPCPPVGPELPIDDNLIILLILGISFGIYSIHRYKIKTKASM